MTTWIVGALALVVTVAICWHWNIGLLGGGGGLHGWGFPIFCGAFGAIYLPVALVRRARQRRQPDKTDGGTL